MKRLLAGIFLMFALGVGLGSYTSAEPNPDVGEVCLTRCIESFDVAVVGCEFIVSDYVYQNVDVDVDTEIKLVEPFGIMYSRKCEVSLNHGIITTNNFYSKKEYKLPENTEKTDALRYYRRC